MAKQSALQINLQYWLGRLILGFLALLPLSLALRLGEAVGRFGLWFPKLRRTGERNLQLALPELSADERRNLLLGSFRNLGRLLGLFSHLAKDDPAALQDLIDGRGLEHIDAARQNGRGVILFTGHIGAWELTSFGLSLFGYPLSFLVRRIDNPKVESLVDRTRERFGNRTIDKRSAAREMLQVLQAGGTLGILIDLNTLGREAIFVDFFGVPAATTFIVAKLALRTGAAVLPVFAPWDKEQRRYILEIGQPVNFDSTNDESDNVRRLTQTLTSIVEQHVRHYPDQWLWIHRRWKTRPPGEPDIYE